MTNVHTQALRTRDGANDPFDLFYWDWIPAYQHLLDMEEHYFHLQGVMICLIVSERPLIVMYSNVKDALAFGSSLSLSLHWGWCTWMKPQEYPLLLSASI